MKYFSLLKKTGLLFFLLLIVSCASKKDVVYYQDIDTLKQLEKSLSYEIKIQPDDLLMISVHADDPEIARSFSLNVSSDARSGAQEGSNYLVDANGSIDFPILGKFKVSGLTRTETLQLITDKISQYIKNPIVNLRVMNFKFSVQGEVNAPGTYNIASERITLIEALSMARDLTIFGKRDNILIIREVDGVKTVNRVDITKSDFINTPYYYLAQNDVIYVEPNKSRVGGAAVNPSTGLIFSAVSVLITLITLVITTTK